MKRPRLMTEDELRTIDRLYEDYHSPSEIARAIGRTSTGVIDYLKRTGQHVPVKRPNFTTADRRKAVDLYQRGYSVAIIMANTGLREGALYKALREAGVPLRRPGLSAAMKEVKRRQAGESAT